MYWKIHEPGKVMATYNFKIFLVSTLIGWPISSHWRSIILIPWAKIHKACFWEHITYSCIKRQMISVRIVASLSQLIVCSSLRLLMIGKSVNFTTHTILYNLTAVVLRQSHWSKRGVGDWNTQDTDHSTRLFTLERKSVTLRIREASTTTSDHSNM